MDQQFGIEIHGGHKPTPHRPPARYLVIIDAAGSATAMLFLESRKLIAEFDAGAEEATQMIRGLTPVVGADGTEWDAALEGHGVAERRGARVYTLDI